MDLLPDRHLSHVDHILDNLRSSSGSHLNFLPNLIRLFAVQLVQMFPVYYIFNFLMTLLLVLHVFWYYLITLIAYRVCSPPFNYLLQFCKTILNP